MKTMKFGVLALTGVLALAACSSPSTPTPGPVGGTPTTPTAKPAVVQGAYYVNAAGVQTPITQADLQNAGNRFVFYAWMEDEAAGIVPTNVMANNGNITSPTEGERIEVAPIQNQNIAAGYVGYRADDGKIYPVVGAGVRWDIDETTDGVNRAIQFSAADEGGGPGGDGVGPQYINDRAKSAWTYTNSATGTNARFPSSNANPTYNMTGITTPDVNGFTWTALFSKQVVPTSATITAIAYINGTEINKQALQKTFAPSAALAITKTVDRDTLGLNETGTFTIRVTNTGQATATNIQLNDILTQGDAAAYTPGTIVASTGTTVTTTAEGFQATIASLAPGATATITLPASANATGAYCDLVNVDAYENGLFGAVYPTLGTLTDDACFTVRAPRLNIVKTLIDANGAIIPSGQTVALNQPVTARITVTNGGDAAATNIVVTDALTNGNAATYAIGTAPTGTTLNGNDGFTSTAFDLAAGASRSFDFAATATADGRYCDTANFTSNNGNPATGTSQEVCFVVTSPALAIAKTNTAIAGGAPINELIPGSSYNSTITVTNSGTGAATQVVVSDLLGRLADGSGILNYGSGTYTLSTGTVVNQTGALSTVGTNGTVAAPTLTVAAGQTLTLNVVTSVPAGARPGQYCDVASYTSANAGSAQTQACVNVVTFVSEQTALSDQIDPIVAGGEGTVVTGSLIVEPTSNEGARNNAVTFNFGATDPLDQLTPGVFNWSSVGVYYDPNPVRDPVTGAVTSNYQNGTSTQLTNGTQYTLNAESGTGQLTVNFNDDFVIAPGGVVFIRTAVTAPAGTASRQYQETMYWTNNAQFSGAAYQNYKTESTTVVASR